ncbi:MAG TPA: FAD-dependent oxidoreductase [Gemmatales bacterium]|nr:FAD-dependent oxidoreductase [Gemmatales bacterium]
MAKVLVVGGGVIGAACAWHLLQAGADVAIVDQGTFGSGCSHGNCGLVCPSHVLPLAAPGAIRATLRAMLNPGSPFSIRPRWDPALWGWLLRFARRCRQRDMMASARALHPLLQSSRQLYDELASRPGWDCDWRSDGLLFVFQSRAGFEHHTATAELLQREFGVVVEAWPAQRLAEQEPALKPGLAGAWFYPADAHLRPDLLMRSWRATLTAAGVQLYENTKVQGFVREQGRIVGVAAEGQTLHADDIVVATGAWTPLLTRDLGVRLPIQPGKGYSITMPRPVRCPRWPIIFEEHHVAVTPFAEGYRLGSTMEFAGYDEQMRPARLELLRRAARVYLHEPEAEPTLEEWWGWRPMTYDGLPLIGRLPQHPQVWIAAGHGMLGITLAPATGKLLAELWAGQPPHVDPAPYAVSRF